MTQSENVSAWPDHKPTALLVLADGTVLSAAKVLCAAGRVPSLSDLPSGCKFHPRCQHRDKVPGDLCRTEEPLLVPGQRGPGHTKRCHIANPDDIYATEVLPESEGLPEAIHDLVEESK